jgi:hypothetical protein
VLHNFEYSWEKRLKKTTFFAVVGTVSSPTPLHAKKYKASSYHTERRKTKRHGKKLAILSLSHPKLG